MCQGFGALITSSDFSKLSNGPLQWTSLEDPISRGRLWFAKAMPPADVVNQSSWHYKVDPNEDGKDDKKVWYVHIQISVPKARQVPVVKSIQPSRNVRDRQKPAAVQKK